MKIRRYLCTLLIAMIAWCTTCATAFADNELIPYDPSGTIQSTISETQTKPSTPSASSSTQTDYAGILFENPQIVKDETVQNVTNSVTNFASILITLVISIAPVLLTIQIVIDVICILFKPVATGFSRLPLQINSNEAIAITGVQFVGSGKDNASTVEKAEVTGNPMLFYFKSRMFTIIIAFTFLVLLGTGLLFKGVFWVANTVTGWVDNIL